MARAGPEGTGTGRPETAGAATGDTVTGDAATGDAATGDAATGDGAAGDAVTGAGAVAVSARYTTRSSGRGLAFPPARDLGSAAARIAVMATSMFKPSFEQYLVRSYPSSIVLLFDRTGTSTLYRAGLTFWRHVEQMFGISSENR